MDEQKSVVEPGEKIPKEDKVYRVIEDNKRARENKFIPSTSCFSLSSTDKEEGHGLSTDWDKKTSPEESVARFGCSFRKTKNGEIEFKPYKNRAVYALYVSFLEEITQVESVIYNPVINNPKVKGYPNNLAHSLIIFKTENFEVYEPLILTKLRDHAKDRKIDVDMDEVDKLVEAYRQS